MSVQNSPVPVPISSTAAQRQFGDVIRRAYSGKEHIIVEQNGLPLVVILSIGEYEALMEEHKQTREREERTEQLARQFETEARQRGISEEQLLEDIKETRKDVYQDRYDKPARS